VSADFLTEVSKMATAGLLVAAVAIPVALVARVLRPKGEPLLPRWKPRRVPWNGFEVLGAFVAMVLVVQLVSAVLAQSDFFEVVYGPDVPSLDAKDVDPEKAKEADALRVMWAVLLAVPILLGLFLLVLRAVHPEWKPAFAGRGSTAGKVWLAVGVWVVITPTVLVFHATVSEVFKHFGVIPEEHPLTKLGNRLPLDSVLFLLQACVAAPLIEEVLFRGILLPWCVGRSKMFESGVSPATAMRPWFVMTAAGMSALSPALAGKSFAPLIFTGLLAVGLALVVRFTSIGARRAAAVYATAALFAIVHSSVWPSPIPLFLLGLALGWLAVRTNGLLVPVIVHGLFNAVSAVFVLRS
jgi:membrane protease YdiL (CAAX protease family)